MTGVVHGSVDGISNHEHIQSLTRLAGHNPKICRFTSEEYNLESRGPIRYSMTGMYL